MTNFPRRASTHARSRRSRRRPVVRLEAIQHLRLGCRSGPSSAGASVSARPPCLKAHSWTRHAEHRRRCRKRGVRGCQNEPGKGYRGTASRLRPEASLARTRRIHSTGSDPEPTSVRRRHPMPTRGFDCSQCYTVGSVPWRCAPVKPEPEIAPILCAACCSTLLANLPDLARRRGTHEHVAGRYLHTREYRSVHPQIWPWRRRPLPPVQSYPAAPACRPHIAKGESNHHRRSCTLVAGREATGCC